MSAKIDPITLEVIKNSLSAAADEMALVTMRSAYSHILRDSMDYSTAICDWAGRTTAQGLTNPIHLGSFPDAMARVVQKYGETARPGDVYIFNDPYSAGGMHLPDVFIIKPVFVDDVLQGFAAAMGHQCDMGGIAPGSQAVYATEIYQEGLRIPMLKLYDAGVRNDTLFEIFAQNVRVPTQVMGDIRAQLAACNAGERALKQLIAKHGAADYRLYVEELHNYAERLMREEILALPDGRYEFEDWLDGLGDKPEPIRFKVAITISGDTVAVDWAGTSDQVKGAINGPMPTTNSMAYLAVRCAVRAPIPNCQGYMRPISVTAPLGSIVNPREPAACAARGIIAYRMLDTMFGALAKAAPDRIPAASEGGPSAISFGGMHEGKLFVMGDGVLGSWGGRRNRDGLEGISNPGCNLSNIPIEVIEAGLPIEIVKYGFVENSGGPGKHRGGSAVARYTRLLADEGVLTLRSDRRRHLPYGLQGGLPGTPSWSLLRASGSTEVLPVCPMSATPMKRGDTLLHVMPGGGGFGDPLERDPQLVLADYINTMISKSYAEDVYGVVIADDDRIDDAATRRRREVIGGSEKTGAYIKHFHQSVGHAELLDAAYSDHQQG